MSSDKSPTDGALPQDVDDDRHSATHELDEEIREVVRRDQLRTGGAPHHFDPHAPVIEGDSVTLRLEIENSSTPLRLTVNAEAIIGRTDPTADERPQLDLTPYSGYQMGISRRHALFRLEQRRLELIDLGSRNGTFLNGSRLQPEQPVPLHDGDEVRLGKIVMRLYVQGGELPES
jgi:hypothetical protein